MTFMLLTAIVTLIISIIVSLELVIGNRKLNALRDVPPCYVETPSRVSVIVPARNEQRNIREALQSLLGLDYPDYELIVVDDRSEDSTGMILDEMVRSFPRLKVIHIDQLPPGWLGKNHAMWVGSKQATGDLLLFTDADIIMEPTVLNRAVAYMEQNEIDHLAAFPSLRMPTIFLSIFGVTFFMIFTIFVRPWKVRDANSRYHIGVGAFNLVRREVYRQIGGHETIRLRPDDDMKLGKIVKKGGFHQEVVFAQEFLAVEWYSSVREVIKGLEKNTFSGADYNIPLVLLGTLFLIFSIFWPLLALLITYGSVRIIYLIAVSIAILAFADFMRFYNIKAWCVFGLPLTSALLAYILLRTMLLNLYQGGIYWRDTFYSLKELKANRI